LLYTSFLVGLTKRINHLNKETSSSTIVQDCYKKITPPSPSAMDNPFGTSFFNFDDEQNENSKQPSEFILLAKIVLPSIYICLQN
jgi:hypothetical protein